MKREEAIARIQDHMERHHIGEYPHIKLEEALKLAITALRGPTREQITKAWRGRWVTVSDVHGKQWSKCGACQVELDELEDAYMFCPHCGAPMTAAAVDKVLKRLEALSDDKN